MKVFFRRIHLYLSLVAGLVILVCCLTGAILVFEKELMMAMHPQRYYVEAAEKRLSADSLVKKLNEVYPGARVSGLKLYEAADRSAELGVTFPSEKTKQNASPAPGKKDVAKPAASQRQPGFTIFMNPYTGAVLEKYSYRETGFYTVFAIHRWLLGGNDSIGKWIVGVSTLIFLFILLTGIILWWPKTKKVMKQRLTLKWQAGWKRINHDMHLVFGFYSAIFLFIFAFTGLAWSFQWFNNGIYKVTSSPIKPPSPPMSTYIAGANEIGFDKALAAAKKIYPSAAYYNVSAAKDSLAAMQVSCLPHEALHESATDAVYVDQYSAAVVGTLPFAERSTGAKVRSTFKPIHTGSIWGTPSKIVAFIVCLLGVTFPVTGSIMWYNRTRGSRKKVQGSGITKMESVKVS
ncbi:MAG: PepSY-associated TM helix domain-containing protein [Flavisolibacter sp.]